MGTGGTPRGHHGAPPAQGSAVTTRRGDVVSLQPPARQALSFCLAAADPIYFKKINKISSWTLMRADKIEKKKKKKKQK